MRRMTEEQRTHIPAQPGWYLHEPVCDRAKLGERRVVGTMRFAIVAWLVKTTVNADEDGDNERDSTYCEPVHVTQLGSRDDDVYVIETPDGEFMEADGSDVPAGCLIEVLDDKQQLRDKITLKHQDEYARRLAAWQASQ